LDFGCGLGDAIPVYKENFPHAKLAGIDISQSAIEKCCERYGTIASFMQGDHNSVPDADIIIASNVFEHLTDDRGVAKVLISKCKSLYIIVPYKEVLSFPEHINTYDEHYFSELGIYDYKVFPCIGWSAYGLHLWYNIYLKNIFRFILGKPLQHRRMQIIFHFKNAID
jgi:SAM-dependent methyltransferase